MRKERVFLGKCHDGIAVIVLPFLELSKNKRVIPNAEFALMSSLCAGGGNMAAAVKYARFSLRELQDSFKTCLGQMKNVRFRVRMHEKQSYLFQTRLAIIIKSFMYRQICDVKWQRDPSVTMICLCISDNLFQALWNHSSWLVNRSQFEDLCATKIPAGSDTSRRDPGTDIASILSPREISQGIARFSTGCIGRIIDPSRCQILQCR
jgi:hypothetical protein